MGELVKLAEFQEKYKNSEGLFALQITITEK